jgi:hypothetical protein
MQSQNLRRGVEGKSKWDQICYECRGVRGVVQAVGCAICRTLIVMRLSLNEITRRGLFLRRGDHDYSSFGPVAYGKAAHHSCLDVDLVVRRCPVEGTRLWYGQRHGSSHDDHDNL